MGRIHKSGRKCSLDGLLDKTPNSAEFIPQSYVVAPTNKRIANNKSEKFCAIHGRNGHSSEECRTIQRLEQAGWKRNNKFPEN